MGERKRRGEWERDRRGEGESERTSEVREKGELREKGEVRWREKGEGTDSPLTLQPHTQAVWSLEEKGVIWQSWLDYADDPV